MQYISVLEYLNGGAELSDLSDDIVANINTLVPKVNQLLEKFGQYRKVSSGLRTMADHLRIYKEINAKREKQGLPPLAIPMKSNHLKGAACDLADPDGKLYKFAHENEQLLVEIGLWCELDTQGWLHVQIVPPKSLRRWFQA